jgi:hypothetical protein
MNIRMYEHKAVMDAGTERSYSPGVTYDVPPVIAEQWVARGMARAVEADEPVPVAVVKPKPKASWKATA